MNKLKERAIARYEEWVKELAGQDKERKAKEEDHARAAFKRLTGLVPDVIEGSLIVKDGLAFQYRSESSYALHEYWRLGGLCPDCGEEVWSRSFHDLTMLGKQLVEFDPEVRHVCPEPEDEVKEPRPDDLIREAVRQIVYDCLEEQGFLNG